MVWKNPVDKPGHPIPPQGQGRPGNHRSRNETPSASAQMAAKHYEPSIRREMGTFRSLLDWSKAK